MNFYKTVCVIALIVLTISLALIGSVLANSSTKITFPPNVASCPDLYITKSNGVCEDSDGNDVSFNSNLYNLPGIGPSSGACEKKKWAQREKVDWDGLTNNPEVCYSTNIS